MIEHPRRQRTLARAAAVDGFGFWSGKDVRVEFHPAPPDTGVVFVRSDLPGQPRIPGHVNNRLSIPRRTVLAAGDATVEMVEHLMAALTGLSLDNCEVRMDGAEVPGMDGSSLAFAEALLAVGYEEQPGVRRRLQVGRSLKVSDGAASISLEPASRLSIDYELDYGPGPVGRQVLDLEIDSETFLRELAPARTFILQHEAEQLLQQGIARRASAKDLLVFDEHGPIDNTLRYADECVRHKMLDVLGDLGLCQADLAGRVTAVRSGHELNARLLKSVLDASRLFRDSDAAGGAA